MHCDRKMSKSKLNVIKIPRESNSGGEGPKAEFPRMPRMYLELIENKDKIKPGMVNKEYDPDEVATVISDRSYRPKTTANAGTSEWNPSNIEEEDEDDEEEEEVDEEEEEDGDDEEEEEEKIKQVEDEEEVLEDIGDEEDEDEDENEDGEEEEEDDKQRGGEGKKKEELDIQKENEEFVGIEDDQEEEEDEMNDGGGFLPPFGGGGGGRRGGDIEEEFDDDFGQFMKRKEKDMPSRMVEDDRASMSSSTRKSAPPLTREENLKKNRVREKLKEILHDPPKLSDLERRGEVRTKKVIPNLPRQTMEEEDELKRELLYKFDLLKRGYKNVDIPEFNMHSDYKNMNKTYENTLRRVSLDSSVENYRNYLIAGFMVMEYVLGYWLRFDMAGFTQQQILNMNQYERMLIELGEKSYVPDDKKWPVELRLLGMIVLNAVIFIIAKMIISKTGTNLFGLMNAQQSEYQKNTHKAKRKMRGPNIDFSNIPDLDDVSTTSGPTVM